MRDPTVTRIDPDVEEAAVAHAVNLLTPFVEMGALWRSDAPIHEMFGHWHAFMQACTALVNGKESELRKLRIRQPARRPSYRFRRAVIIEVIEEVEALGFHRRRNPANHGRDDKRASACAVVSKALYRLGVGMSEGAVVDLVRPLRPKKPRRR
jgi:hypothetical protein